MLWGCRWGVSGTPLSLGSKVKAETAPEGRLPECLCRREPRGAAGLWFASFLLQLCLEQSFSCLGSGGNYLPPMCKTKTNQFLPGAEQMQVQEALNCSWPSSWGVQGRSKGSSWTTVPQAYPGGRESSVTRVPPRAGIPLSPADGRVPRPKLTRDRC